MTVQYGRLRAMTVRDGPSQILTVCSRPWLSMRVRYNHDISWQSITVHNSPWQSVTFRGRKWQSVPLHASPCKNTVYISLYHFFLDFFVLYKIALMHFGVYATGLGHNVRFGFILTAILKNVGYTRSATAIQFTSWKMLNLYIATIPMTYDTLLYH